MKKKTTAKKATPKVPEKKLIDGLYSHKFNCRILPDSGKAMEVMMQNKGLKSFNKAINIALLEYTEMYDRIGELLKEIDDLKSENRNTNNAVSNFRDAFTELNGLKI